MSAVDENVSHYWRKFFEKHPELLAVRALDAAKKQWLKDHPDDKEVPISALNGLTNVKSVMRNQTGVKVKKKKKRGRPRKHVVGENGLAPTMRTVKPSPKLLDALEDQIDRCLHLIAHPEEAALQKIVHHLKQARRAVIQQMAN